MAAPKRVIVTGGASANTAVVSVLSDVFGVPVFRSETVQSAALGAFPVCLVA
jgi:sugar (pentulose or hexulose) kinase